MNSKYHRNDHSSKRRPSKRVLTAQNEIRAARLINEFDEDDHDWKRERKLKVHNLHPPTSQLRTNKVSQLKQKRRQIHKLNQEDF